MNPEALARHFKSIGAAIQITEVPRETTTRRPRARLVRWGSGEPVSSPSHILDVRPMREHRQARPVETFTLRVNEGVQVNAVHIDPELRHLLLNVNDGTQKAKYLCGHDERHWFVAGVANNVTTVRTAMESLQPPPVAEKTRRLKTKDKLSRRNDAFVRQGEWFFVPEPKLRLPATAQVYKHEPLRRNTRSKPHMAEELTRHGGTVVYLCSHFRTGATAKQWREHKASGAFCHANTAVRDAIVYVRGKISHADHKTVTLKGWHRVFMNNEPFRAEVAFLD